MERCLATAAQGERTRQLTYEKELAVEGTSTEETKVTEPCLNGYVVRRLAGVREDDYAEGNAEDDVREECINKYSWSDGKKSVSRHAELVWCGRRRGRCIRVDPARYRRSSCLLPKTTRVILTYRRSTGRCTTLPMRDLCVFQ